MTPLALAYTLTAVLAQNPPRIEVNPENVRRAVRAGLEWLANDQRADGSWSTKGGETYLTATAGLALLMEGSTPKEGRYAPHLRKTIAWFLAHTNDDGLIIGDDEEERKQYQRFHTYALLFLACAYEADDDPGRRTRLAPVLKKGAAFLTGRQTKNGGWGYTHPRDEDDYDYVYNGTHVLQALLAVRRAGIEVSETAIEKGFRYLERASTRSGSVIFSLGAAAPGDTDWCCGVMAAVAAYTDDRVRPPLLRKWATNAAPGYIENCLVQTEAGHNGLYQDLWELTIVRYRLGDAGHKKIDPGVSDAAALRWSPYRARVFRVVLNKQLRNGSWAEPFPLYPTIHALLMLQIENGYVPLFAR